jgi:predicted flap endonuclease-1-like 5' DNA nuclease
MTYLIMQILLCLLAAFLLGLLLGWWLWSRGCEKKIEAAVSDWRGKFDRAEVDWKAKLADVEARLKGAKADTGDAKANADLIAKLKAEIEAHKKRGDAAEASLSSVRSDAEAKISALMAQLAELKTAAEPDDLTRIEGIGPKIQELIFAARIFTFVALSKTSVEKLKEILDGGGERFQMHDPKTWPEQAQLAADGQWEKLDELQDLLRGGRED